jgi:diaminopimelate decarboxylase
LSSGRSLVGNSGILVTKVLYLKRKFEGSGKNFAIVDAGMNDLMRPSLYNSYHDIMPVIEESSKGNSECWEIVGPICESGDWLAKERNINLRED